MIFSPVSEVEAAWEVVAKATANNELGIAAKVAPKLATGANTEHLICVYTADFNNKQDVKRVASALHRLGFLPSTGKPLYYKPGELHETRSLIMPARRALITNHYCRCLYIPRHIISESMGH